MIDIHTHLLPGIDDGASDLDAALDMLMMAANSGVEGIVTTPHCNIPDELDNYASPGLERLWDRLNDEVLRRGIPVSLYRGMEVFTTPDVPELLEQGKIWTINGTAYILMEFSFNEDPEYCTRMLERCAGMGYRPVVAHPERYYFIQDDPTTAYDWCVSGFGLQLNKGSLLGRFGDGPRRTAELLMDHGLAACVASDAHSPYQRTTDMGEIRRYLADDFGEDYMRLLLDINPEHIINGEELLGYEPVPFD